MHRLSPTPKQQLDYAEPTAANLEFSATQSEQVRGVLRPENSGGSTTGGAVDAPAAFYIGTGWTCRVWNNSAVGVKQQAASRLCWDRSRDTSCGLHRSGPCS